MKAYLEMMQFDKELRPYSTFLNFALSDGLVHVQVSFLQMYNYPLERFTTVQTKIILVMINELETLSAINTLFHSYMSTSVGNGLSHAILRF